MAEHGGTSHFVTAFTDKVPKEFLGPAYEIKDINNTYELNILISENYQLSSEPWSVFQALVDLTRIAKEQLGFTPKGKALNRKIYLNKNKTQYLIPEGNDNDYQIHFKKESAYNWDTIAHEFSHAILIETGAIIPQTGDHTTDKNLYDYDKEPKVYKNKEAACALAFGEGGLLG